MVLSTWKKNVVFKRDLLVILSFVRFNMQWVKRAKANMKRQI